MDSRRAGRRSVKFFRGPLGIAWLPGYGTEVDGTQRFAQLLMYDDFAWAIHRAQHLSFSGGTTFRDQVVRFPTELFLNAEFAAPGRLMIGNVVSASGQTNEFTSLRNVLAATRTGHMSGVFAGYYGIEARLALLIGLEAGIEGIDRHRVIESLGFLNDPKRHPGMFVDPLQWSGFGLAGPEHPVR